MKKILSILLLALTVSVTANAQEFLDNLRGKQTGKGNVSVSQSSEIDALLKGSARQQQQTQQLTQQKQQQSTQHKQQQSTQQKQQQPTQKQKHNDQDDIVIISLPATTKPSTSTQSQQKEQAEQKNPVTQPKKETPAAQQQTTYDEDVTTHSVDTRKKVMRKSYRMPGYRVQVFSGGNSREDKEKAYNAGATIKRKYPDQPVYMHFKSPSWKCRVGNFKSQHEAQQFLAQVKKLGFRQATVVKVNIQVQY